MKYFFTLLAIGFASMLSAQAIAYDFSHYTSEYEMLAQDIPLNENSVWDDPNWVVPIGFPFQYNGNYYTHLRFRGFNSYGGELRIYNPGFEEGGNDFIFPFAQDLRDLNYFNEKDDTPLSPVTFQTSGNLGNRIFKLQWDDAGFYNDGSSTMKMDMQVWFYEAGGVIEFHYGEQENIDPNTIVMWNGFFVGIGVSHDPDNGDYVAGLMYLNGLADDPSAFVEYDTNVEAIGQLDMLVDIPQNGQVYRFDNTVNVSDMAAENEVQLIPTMDTNTWQVVNMAENTGFQIFSVDGKLVEQGICTGYGTISLNQATPGMYLIALGKGESMQTTKVLVK